MRFRHVKNVKGTTYKLYDSFWKARLQRGEVEIWEVCALLAEEEIQRRLKGVLKMSVSLEKLAK